ncbi:hypothetical protein H1P_490011 [Hyella patelloides LEGE 07179]|uniref:Uncharacterized protein n=1 Tax=Hyella patelloides LEGE 07179 TaxID=945734 RepID=A0A563VZ79_9CYAN|nr:hypothetical protein H1P_490011 [Hyella patelloides LEGE 07179]
MDLVADLARERMSRDEFKAEAIMGKFYDILRLMLIKV